MNLLVTSKSRHDKLFNSLFEKEKIGWKRIKNIEDFTVENLERINPRFIFIPHWSHIIPEKIYNRWECIVFHMTDLPYGRGGSPLQNLIVRGLKTTKITAFKVEKGIDTGAIYLKRDLELSGTASEILARKALIIEEMIEAIIRDLPKPIPQKGMVTEFKRRKPFQSDLSELKELKTIYDYIRMLDADGYPKAFLETAKFRFEFESASFDSENKLKANVTIVKKQ